MVMQKYPSCRKSRYTVRIWNKYIQYICSSYYLNPELHEPKFLLPPQDKSRTWGVKQISCLINLGVIGWVILGRQEKTSQHLHRNLRILDWYGFTSQYHIFQVVCECQACGRPCNISLHSQVLTSYFSNIYMYICMMLFCHCSFSTKFQYFYLMLHFWAPHQGLHILYAVQMYM